MHVFGLKESLKVTHLIVHVNKIISLHNQNLLTFSTFDLNVLMKHQCCITGEVGEQLLLDWILSQMNVACFVNDASCCL